MEEVLMDVGILVRETENEKEVNDAAKSTVGGNDGESSKGKDAEKESSKGKDAEKESSEDIVPKEGMEFNSLKEVQDFYNNYAQKIGFGIKIRGTWKRGNMVTKCILSCCREGKCDETKQRKYIRSTNTSRCGCHAQISARLLPDGLWHLTKVNLEHNHLVSPSKVKFLRGNKSLNNRAKRKIGPNDQPGIPSSESLLTCPSCGESIENLGCKEKVAGNCAGSARRLRLKEGDDDAIRLYFMHQQKLNYNFFQLMDFDNEGYLRNVFWADARCRASFQYFGDVISFNTTSLIKKYDIPFVSFVGVNNHGQSMLLGCGLLSDETVDSYEWLFTAWLTCMSGRPPSAIFTLQCPSIQAAVSKIFPRTKHRLCLSHIMKEVPKKLEAYKEHEEIIWMMKNIVYDSMRAEEFDQCWWEMIEKFSLQENAWLQSLFDIRHKWVPLFVKDSFWAGISATACCESMSAFSDGSINLKTSLKKFISQFDVALNQRYENESLADFNSFNKEQDLVLNLPYAKEVRKFYTTNMFVKFQDEMKNMVNCRVKRLEENGPISKYEVRERRLHDGVPKPIVKNFEVWFHANEVQVQCICRSFEFQGILCSHATSVLEFNNVPQLPSQYIVPRWRKDFKHLYAQERSSSEFGGLASAPMECHDYIYMYCHKIAEIGSRSEQQYKKALSAIKKLEEELLTGAGDKGNDSVSGL